MTYGGKRAALEEGGAPEEYVPGSDFTVVSRAEIEDIDQVRSNISFPELPSESEAVNDLFARFDNYLAMYNKYNVDRPLILSDGLEELRSTMHAVAGVVSSNESEGLAGVLRDEFPGLRVRKVGECLFFDFSGFKVEGAEGEGFATLALFPVGVRGPVTRNKGRVGMPALFGATLRGTLDYATESRPYGEFPGRMRTVNNGVWTRAVDTVDRYHAQQEAWIGFMISPFGVDSVRL